MNFEIRKIGDRYMAVVVREGGVEIDLGLLDPNERAALAHELCEAAEELDPQEDHP